ncbi:ATP-binding protein [Empedobacter brevis]|uniref:ATP-binding protein n=1 Tax=Empedobacter brevis TaxID=247 RepID=UPI0033417139
MNNNILRFGSFNNEPKKVIKIPKVVNASNVETFLKNVSIVFTLENTVTKNYVLDLSYINKINVLGMLLIYKVIEYSVKKNCFLLPSIHYDEFMDSNWGKYGFIPLINAYVENQETSEKLKQMNIVISDHFIIAPQPLIRNTDFSNDFLKTTFLPKIQSYYKENEKIVSMISTFFSEILLNFWEHAVEDTQSVMIADGRDNYIEIACADTGNGIISTLRKNKKYNHYSDKELLEICVDKNITSKSKTNHMGYGLWIINEFCKISNGRFHLYSEDYCYKLDYGKKIINKIPFWKGTIVYLALPLDNKLSLEDIPTFNKYKNTPFKVAFI